MAPGDSFCSLSPFHRGGSSHGLPLPVVVTEEVPVLKYHHRARIDYRVRLKPNAFYSAPVLRPGQTYLTNFVQGVETLLTYRFAAGEKVKLNGSSRVTATVEVLMKEGEKSHKVWERSFALALPKEFRQEGGAGAAFSDRVLLNLGRFSQMVEAFGKASGINLAEARFLLTWEVKAQVSSPKGTASQILRPTLVIPLSQKAFAVGGEPKVEKSGAFTAERTVYLNSRKRLKFGLLAASVAFSLALFLFGFLTQSHQLDAAEKVRRAIQKRASAFVVEAARAGEKPPQRVVSLATIDDLVKAADELGKPVVHQVLGPGKEAFYILDGEVRYEFLWEG